MPKKIILSVFVLCASLSFLCASEENSGLLLEKGARFEREGETVYALGAYYDALVENPASLEAYGAYKALSESIASGNPGRDIVEGELELYEQWMALLANAEKYWTENIPYKISLGELAAGKIDFKTKTGSYSLSAEFSFGEKYGRIIETILEGLSKACTDEWPDIVFDNNGRILWPKCSVAGFSGELVPIEGDRYEFVGDEGAQGYMKDGIAVFVPYNTDTGDVECSYEYIMRPQNAFAAVFEGSFLYDIEVSLVDESGKTYESARSFPCLSPDGAAGAAVGPLHKKSVPLSFKFENLSSKELSLIKKGTVFPVVSGIFLKYGRTNLLGNGGGEDDVRSFAAALDEIALPSEKVLAACERGGDESMDEIIKSMERMVRLESFKDAARAIVSNPEEETRDNVVFDAIRIDADSPLMADFLGDGGEALSSDDVLSLLNAVSPSAPFEKVEEGGKVLALRKNEEKTQTLLAQIAEREARLLAEKEARIAAEKKAHEEAVEKRNRECAKDVLSSMGEVIRDETVLDVVTIDSAAFSQFKHTDGSDFSVEELLAFLDDCSKELDSAVAEEIGEGFCEDGSSDGLIRAVRVNTEKTRALAKEKAEREARIVAEKKAQEERRKKIIARGRKIFSDIGISFSPQGDKAAFLTVQKGSFAEKRLKVKSGTIRFDQIILNVDSKCKISYGVINGTEIEVTMDDFLYEVGQARSNVGVLDYPREGKSFFIDF